MLGAVAPQHVWGPAGEATAGLLQWDDSFLTVGWGRRPSAVGRGPWTLTLGAQCPGEQGQEWLPASKVHCWMDVMWTLPLHLFD